MTKEEELWKDIPTYEGHYRVSNLGRVKSLNFGGTKKEGILKPFITGEYLTVSLSLNGKEKDHRIHQLVAIYFLGHTPCGYKAVINHKDFNKLNNRVDNLEVVSNRENCNKKHLKSSSKFVGVSWYKSLSKWKSRIDINGKVKHLGYFNTEEEASAAYQKELKELKG